MTNGADLVAAAIRDAGIETVFGLPGAHNLALWPALHGAGIRVVGTRHEQAAAHAADGGARVTGDVGVVAVTTGPGAANTVGAVGEAWASRVPLVVIATDIPSTVRRPHGYRGALHETDDQAAMFAPVTKARMRAARPDDCGTCVRDALAVARTAPTRPVYVEVPTDFLTTDVEPRRDAGLPANRPRALDSRALEHAVALLASARRPLLWVGGGARGAGAQVATLADRLGAPVVTTYQGRGVVPADHPLLVAAPPHEPEVTALVGRADVAVVVGSDLDAMTTQAWRLPLPDRRIAVNLDAADAVKNYTMDVTIEADAGATADLAAAVEPRAPWAGDLAALGATIRARLAADPATADAVALLERTEGTLPRDAAVFADMCVAGYWLAGHLRVPLAGALHYPMGWGTLGYAFPASIGAAAAQPAQAAQAARPVVAFVGDGGFLFSVGELATVAQEGLALTVVVVDDGGYGMLRFGHESGARIGSDLSSPHFVDLARAFGVDGEHVDGFGADYSAALARAVDSRRPRLLHVTAALTPPVSTSPRWPLAGAPVADHRGPR